MKKDKGEKDAGHNTEPGGVRASPLGDARALKARGTDADTRGDATLEVRDGERPRPRRDRRRTAMSARRGRISGR